MRLILTSLSSVKIWRATRGQSLVEYAMLAGFLVCAAGAVLPDLSTDVSTVFSKVADALSQSAGTETGAPRT